MYDITIIGCGVIGASLAYRLSRYDLRVLVLERENDVAMGTTKANSAIVHAGYDPMNGTLMAKLNVRGSEMMEGLCKDLDVHYQRSGSLVIAFSKQELLTLQEMYENGKRNGVPGLKLLSAEQTHAMEPNLADTVRGALYAPSAAIIDPWGLCIAEAETAVKNGVELRLRAAVTGIEQQAGHVLLHTSTGDVQTRFAVNCTGTHAHELAEMAGGEGWEAKPTRGEYYLLDKSSGDLVKHVIFQCPSSVGKGVLVSPTVHGNLIVGPNAADADDADDKRTTAPGLHEVQTVARRSVPTIDIRQCIRTFAGVRAITNRPDFIIEPDDACPGLLHLAGIKSPGLSAAPAIAVYAEKLLGQMGVCYAEKPDFDGTRRVTRFKHLSGEEKAKLVSENPLYGRVICRCETITEGEIVDAIHSPIPPCSIDGVKRRAGAGMGRCQGGFCGPRVMEILARELKTDQMDILQDQDGTFLITGQTKMGGAKA